MSPKGSIAELAAIIADNTKIVDDYLKSNGLSAPSFDVDGPIVLSIPAAETEVIKARQTVIASTEELNKLMKGPVDTLWSTFLLPLGDILEVQFVQRFDIVNLVPLDGTASYEDLATATGLDAVDIRRVLKRAILNHLFQEKDGKVAHTAMSRVLRENSTAADIAKLFTNEAWPSFAKTVEALDQYKGRTHIPEETGFSLANNTPKGMYAFLAENPTRMEAFGKAMSGFAVRYDFAPVIEGFDWKKISTMVDVGGALGPCSIALAQAFPNLTFTVQDLEPVVAKGPPMVPETLRDRISFEVHDMFQPQKRKGADVYFFRAIFHNWSDVRCVEILRAQIPALKPGAHIIIVDRVLGPPGSTPPWMEKTARTMDLTMLAFFGARERSLEDWVKLVQEASPAFRVNYAGPPSQFIDLVWEE